MKLWQRLAGRMVVIISATILLTCTALSVVVSHMSAARGSEVLADSGEMFMNLAVALGRSSGVDAATAVLQQGGVRVETAIPAGYRPWSSLRTIREQAVSEDLNRRHPGAQVVLNTTPSDNAFMWVRAPDVLGGRWLGFLVTVSLLSSSFRAASLLAALAIVVIVIATYVARQISRPLEELAEAATQIGRGIDPPLWKPKGSIEVRRLGEELQQAAAEIRRTLRDREYFLAGISHDLRTPLSRLRLALDLLRPEVEDRELVDGMSQDLDEMGALIHSFVDHLRQGIGERPASVDIDALVEEVAQVYRGYGHPVRVTACGSPGDPLRADVFPLAFRRMLRNLIQNAIDHGTVPIDIDISATDQAVLVGVRDHGRGLSEKRLAVMARRAGRRLPFGLRGDRHGLGLSIAGRVVDSHRGKLRIANAQPGLRVEVEWPRQRSV